MSIFEKMAGLELLPRSGFRADRGSVLQIHFHESPVRVGDDAIALGRRRSATEVFLGAALVLARARFDFHDRVRFALGPSRRTDRLKRNYSGPRISSRGARATGRPRIVDLADFVLVQFERCVSSFSLRRGSCAVVASDFRNRARALTG